ncbi:M56 family metallopeptidase [Paenibacillus sp. J2TS4]|uniref:M56 family metallopeptidase n=1 Tax=Paenibacillus sp. J2TS4 TaxID=2807194 RepID=UPI001BCEDBA9|nr:M56 family metallopeptidase [Paenibacillus sp. J2TS4]
MNLWLELLVALTVAGSAVVVCMLLLRLVSAGAIPATWHYVMGKVALISYLLPAAFVIQWLPFYWREPLASANLTHLGTWAEITSGLRAAEPITTEWMNPEQTISAAFASAMLSLWGLGAVIYAAWHVYAYIRFIRRLHTTSFPLPQDSEAARLLSSSKIALGIRSKVRLACNSEIESPVLVGLLKPTILIPIGHRPGIDLGMVIHHELIHLKRKDLWVKMFSLGASSIHWFNPFVHVLRKDIHVWSELSCDEEVVRGMSHAERKRYGETILNVVEGSSGVPVRFCASLSGSGKQLKRRLTMLLKVKKLKKHTVLLTAAAVMAIGAIGTSTAAWASKNIPQVEAGAGQPPMAESVSMNNNKEEFVENVKVAAPDLLAKGNSFETRLIAVSPSDESKFTPEEWKNILAQIERGEVYWEDSEEFKEMKDKVMNGELTWGEALGYKSE